MKTKDEMEDELFILFGKIIGNNTPNLRICADLLHNHRDFGYLNLTDDHKSILIDLDDQLREINDRIRKIYLPNGYT